MPRSNSITGDAKQVKALLQWAKAEGVELTEVSVGSCRVTVGPARVASSRPPVQASDRETIYRQFGGEVFTELAVDGELQPVVRSR